MLIITAKGRERLSATNSVNIIKRIAEIGRKEVNMAKNNYPQAGLDEIEPAAVQQIVSSLKELHDNKTLHTQGRARASSSLYCHSRRFRCIGMYNPY